MPTYTTYLTYTVSDTVSVEADNHDEAYEIARWMYENDPTFEPLQVSTNSIYSWDGVEISIDTDPESVVD